MLVITILKIDDWAAPGTVTFTGRRERAVQERGAAVWRGSAPTSSLPARKKFPGYRSSYLALLPRTAWQLQLVQMCSSKDGDRRFLEQGSKVLLGLPHRAELPSQGDKARQGCSEQSSAPRSGWEQSRHGGLGGR